MKTELTVIVDNGAGCGLQGEWGLSILAEYGDRQILLDTGASTLFLTNLKALGFNVRRIDFGVLSHAHYDHANGIPAFFRQNENAIFYLRQGTAPNCYAKKAIFRKYIGIPRRMTASYPERIEFAEGCFQPCEGVWLIPHSTPGLSEIGRRERMYRREGIRWAPDDFSHEQSLVLETDRGLVILNSCSHGGVPNILREVREALPDKPIYGIIGGFHLFNKPEAEIRALGRELREAGLNYVCTGHCTKDRAYGLLKQELGERLEQLRVGLRICF